MENEKYFRGSDNIFLDDRSECYLGQKEYKYVEAILQLNISLTKGGIILGFSEQNVAVMGK